MDINYGYGLEELHLVKELLAVTNLQAAVGDKKILRGLNLQVNAGEVHVIMGPNGAGKSTLANILMGHPKYNILDGNIVFLNQNINDLRVHERAKLGIFLSFQYPEEIPGVTLENFLRASKGSVSGKNPSLISFRRQLFQLMNELGMKEEYAIRYLNEGFSGGEKKKSEILQMLILEPKLAILDETDSGLDVDAVRIVASGVKKYMNRERSVIIITHHRAILDYLKPDYVHILVDGQIVKNGTAELVEEIEENGFDHFRAQIEVGSDNDGR